MTVQRSGEIKEGDRERERNHATPHFALEVLPSVCSFPFPLPPCRPGRLQSAARPPCLLPPSASRDLTQITQNSNQHRLVGSRHNQIHKQVLSPFLNIGASPELSLVSPRGISKMAPYVNNLNRTPCLVWGTISSFFCAVNSQTMSFLLSSSLSPSSVIYLDLCMYSRKVGILNPDFYIL